MYEIRLALEDNLDTDLLAKGRYNAKQMREIRLGLLYKVDVKLYLSPKLSWLQMYIIRNLLIDGYDVSDFI